jgi:hypothetical protein
VMVLISSLFMSNDLPSGQLLHRLEFLGEIVR